MMCAAQLSEPLMAKHHLIPSIHLIWLAHQASSPRILWFAAFVIHPTSSSRKSCSAIFVFLQVLISSVAYVRAFVSRIHYPETTTPW
jgi:hypothetical protein